jgi:hypothetical protein
VFARSLALIAAAASLAVACRAATEPAQPSERPAVGLMTTLPLIWGEAADVGEILAAEAGAGWVRQELEQRFVLEPLDTLDEATLAGLDRLVLAQPRALSPAENVTLDAWVRDGGRLLLFADPMLTRHSRYAVGDRRRPQDVALLSPILAHWGLELMFDDEQAAGERIVAIEGTSVPVDLAGRFRLAPDAPCDPAAGGLVVRCRIGKGSVLAFADAAVLDEPEDGETGPRGDGLHHLLALAFD